MYYEHDVNVKLRINSRTDEVRASQVANAIKDTSIYNYEVTDTRLITATERIAVILDNIDNNNTLGIRSDHDRDLAVNVLRFVKKDIEDFEHAQNEIP